MPDELISCILATGNRNRFFPQALRCFQSQTWPNRELIVVDDGETSVARLCRGTDNVKHIRLNRRTPVGTKLNIGIANSAGAILQKLDDDDYYAPRFLETAATRLLANRSRRAIAAWDSFLIMLAGSPALYFSGRGWLAGGTLCFRRAVWDAAPFRDVPKDEDAFFLEDHAGPRIRIRAPEQYILLRHGRNTWKTFRNRTRVDAFVRSREVYPKSIADIVSDAEASRFYARLRRFQKTTAPG
jgi:glycosyltransferase involved in cell wall biosynthesis